VKGLLFNVVETLARSAGCSADAWELVAEFAQSGVEDDGPSAPFSLNPRALNPSAPGDIAANAENYRAASLAMLGSLSHDLDEDDAWPLGDTVSDWPAEVLWDALALPSAGGFGPAAFRDGGWRQLRRDAFEFRFEEEEADDPDADKEFRFSFSPYDPNEH
jgi:hypothetical protein